jgi:hypothetical protein
MGAPLLQRISPQTNGNEFPPLLLHLEGAIVLVSSIIKVNKTDVLGFFQSGRTRAD